jgi:putative transposase
MNVPGIISHITQRASGAGLLFQEDDDYLEMLARLKHVSGTHELEVLSLVLMPNHVHLLLRQAQANLDEAMRELFSRYAQRHNSKYERKGHLFGGPYRQAVCLDEAYVLAASLYIHLNPVGAGLLSQPQDYRWSSCRLFSESKPTESFVSPQMILNWLSPDPEEARRSYREMLEQGRQLKLAEVIEDQRAIHRFKWGLTKLIPLMSRLRIVPKTSSPQPIEQAELEARIAGFAEGNTQVMPQTREGKKYLVEQLISRGFTRGEIAQRLGVSRKTIYNLLS